MIIKIIEPIGILEDAIRSRIGDLMDEGGHQLLICETRGLSDADVIKVIKDADVLLLGSRPLSGNVINACPKLKLICVAFTGVDHVDQEACKKRGIKVQNAAGYALHAVSELAIGLMIALFRRIILANTKARAGGTNEGLMGHELLGKPLGGGGSGS